MLLIPSGQEDDAPALPDYPQDLADGVRLLCEVLLRHGLHLRQHAVQVAAEKLVVAHDEVEGVGPESRGREDIVLARGVVGYDYVRLAAIGLYVVDICEADSQLFAEQRVGHADHEPEFQLVNGLELAVIYTLFQRRLIHKAPLPSKDQGLEILPPAPDYRHIVQKVQALSPRRSSRASPDLVPADGILEGVYAPVEPCVAPVIVACEGLEVLGQALDGAAELGDDGVELNDGRDEAYCHTHERGDDAYCGPVAHEAHHLANSPWPMPP